MAGAARRTGSARGPALALALVLALCLHAPATGGSEVELHLRTVGQGYQTRTIEGRLLNRYRITQWLSLRAVRLFEHRGLRLDARLRLDTDLGLTGDPEADGAGALDLLALNLQARDLFDRLDVTLGRQWLLDAIDFCQLDGLRLDLKLPAGFGLRLLGGFAVRDRSWLGGRLLELDGVDQGHTPAPLVGAAASWRWRATGLRISYRRTVLWQPGWPLDGERLGAAGWSRWFDGRLGVESNAVYDLARDRLGRVRADVHGRLPWPPRDLRLEVGFLRLVPHFALDSIFDFFSPAPFWQLRAGLRWRAPGERFPLSLGLGGYFRRYGVPAAPAEPGAHLGRRVLGAELDGRLRLGRAGWLWLLAGFEDGAAGRRWMLAPGVSWGWLDGALRLDGRALLLSVDDPVRDSFDALSAGGAAGLRWRFGPGRGLLLSTELHGNRVNPLRWRLSAVLDLAFVTGPGGLP